MNQNMRITVGLLLVSSICGGLLDASAVALHHVISKDLDGAVDELYDSYISISGNQDDSNDLDVISQVQQVFLGNPKLDDNRIGKPQTLKQTAYLLVKSRQRDKRYISYLTLCHFKICNMGRKRTTRYFHVIRRLDDNDP